MPLRTISQKLFDKLPENFRKDIEDENEKKKNKKNAPKKSKTGYNIFVQEKHPEFKGQKDAMAQIGALWKGLDDAGKKVYNDRAVVMKAEETAATATTSSSSVAEVAPKEKKARKSKKPEAEAVVAEPIAAAVVEPEPEAAPKKVKKVKKVVEAVVAE